MILYVSSILLQRNLYNTIIQYSQETKQTLHYTEQKQKVSTFGLSTIINAQLDYEILLTTTAIDRA